MYQNSRLLTFFPIELSQDDNHVYRVLNKQGQRCWKENWCFPNTCQHLSPLWNVSTAPRQKARPQG